MLTIFSPDIITIRPWICLMWYDNQNAEIFHPWILHVLFLMKFNMIRWFCSIIIIRSFDEDVLEHALVYSLHSKIINRLVCFKSYELGAFFVFKLISWTLEYMVYKTLWLYWILLLTISLYSRCFLEGFFLFAMHAFLNIRSISSSSGVFRSLSVSRLIK